MIQIHFYRSNALSSWTLQLYAQICQNTMIHLLHIKNIRQSKNHNYTFSMKKIIFTKFLYQ